MSPRIALATCAEFPDLCDDDRALLPAFASAGIDVAIRGWRDDVRWTDFDGVLIRSTWDYYRHASAFLEWLDRLERGGVPCWNEPSLVRWNADKRYLRELASRGVATVPTLWFESGVGVTTGTVIDAILAAGFSDVVLKPTVSAGAWRTHRFRTDELASHVPAIAELLASGALLAQPFLPEIVSGGEHSLLFFDGEFSHAVIKRPKPGDFRVQWVHGGSQEAEVPARSLVSQAQAVLDAAPAVGLYARVDGVVRDGRFILMELEQIEPFLFLAEAPAAAGRLARALRRRLDGGGGRGPAPGG